MFQARLNTSLGSIRCTFEGDRLVGLHFERRRRAATGAPASPALRHALNEIRAYLEGKRREIAVPCEPRGGTPFQRRVWAATRAIPYGEVRGYGWIAAHIGAPGAARAVGQALARNPLPLLIPCHRVVAAGGKLGGFTGGLPLKRKLLQLEGALDRRGALHRDTSGRED